MKNVLLVLFFLLPFSILSKGIVIDHNFVDINKLTKENIKLCTSTLKVVYQHTSHGSQLVSGLDALASYNSDFFTYGYSNYGYNPLYFFNDYGMPDAGDLGSNGDLAWVDATKTVLNVPGCDRNVVMWSWCGGCSENTISGIDKYLNAMNDLEIKYPNVVFVYMTGHLDGSGEEGNLNINNNRIREYCKTNGKVLFDFADIESFAPGGTTNYMILKANDACDYHNGNWADEWLAANPNSPLVNLTNSCGGCAHSHNLNCALKGIATWQMFEWIAKNRLNGPNSVEQDSIKDNAITNIFPNPADNKINIDFYIKEKSSSIRIDAYDMNGNHVKNFLNDVIRNEGDHKESFDILSLPIGTYSIRLMIGDEYKTKSFVVVR